MNLLFAIDCINLGGAQTFLLRLVRAMAPNHRIAIYVLTPAERDQQLEESFLGGLEVEIIQAEKPKISPRQSSIIGLIGNVLYRFGYRTFRKDVTNRIMGSHLRAIVKERKIDCVNSHLFSSDWRVFQSIGNTKVNWVVSLHGCYETFLHGGYGDNFRPNFIDPNFIKKAADVYGRANALVLASDKNREIEQYLSEDLLSQVRREKIYYGFQPNAFTPKRRQDYGIPTDSLVFGMVARGIETKGWKYLLEAFAELAREEHSIHLVLVCDLSEHIEELTSQYRQADILFTGPSYNPLEWVSMLDVAVLPTYFSGESLPNTVIEYLYAGKPVIATDIGDIDNMISYEQEKAGILIPLAPYLPPDPKDLQNAMRMYLTDSELRTKHGKTARLAFQKFSMDVCVKSYLELFAS